MKNILAVVAALALPASCAFAQCVTSIERDSETIGPEAQVRTLSVVAPDGCVWNAASRDGFVQIVSKPASGSGTLTYKITANPFTTARTARIDLVPAPSFSLQITQTAAAVRKPFRGDINGDGLLDAFLRSGADSSGRRYIVRFGTPSLTWEYSNALPVSGDHGLVMAMGDFKGDGHAGYALYDPVTLQVEIMFVDEHGAATPAAVRKIVSPSWEIAGSGDFDGDGKSDLLLRNVPGGMLSIWFMNGATLRDAPLVSTRVLNPSWQIAALADFDLDGKSDILFRNVLTGGLSIWKMNGTTVTSLTDVVSKPLPWLVVDAGDFDGDGNFDLLYRHPVTGAIEWHLMHGLAVTSVVPDSVSVPALRRVVAIGDVNGDSSDDVVFLSNRGNLNSFRTMSTTALVDFANLAYGFAAPRYWRRTAVSDFNGDGRSDLLLRHADDYVATWEMNGTMVLRDTIFARVSSPAWAFQKIAPFSGDLMSDVQLSNQPPYTNYLATWDLAGQVILSSDEIGTAPGRNVIGAGDFDGDGNADLLLQNTATRMVEVWLMAGHKVRGAWSIDIPETDETFDGIGDFDEDGVADVIWRKPAGHYIAWLMAGEVRRERRVLGMLSASWKTLAICDFDGDGMSEILQRSTTTDEVAIASYNGSQSPMSGRIVGGAGPDGRYQAAGDYDGDGDAEILIRNAGTGAMTMWFISANTLYDRKTFASVSSPLWQIVGAYEPAPANVSSVPAAASAFAAIGASALPYRSDERTSQPVQ